MEDTVTGSSVAPFELSLEAVELGAPPPLAWSTTLLSAFISHPTPLPLISALPCPSPASQVGEGGLGWGA